jgi:hypothetical protein
MVQPESPWADVAVPASVAHWIRAMSRRAGAPAHQIVRVLIDCYIQRMPAAARKRLAGLLQRRQHPTQ